MPIVVIGSEPIRHKSGPFLSLLEANGFEAVSPVADSKLTEAELLAWLPRGEAIIAGGETISDAIMAASPRLRVIARTGVGYDAVDVPAATRRGIVVTITPGANQEAVAEQTFALLLALLKDLIQHDQSVKLGRWIRSPLPRPARGQTLGLVGLGRIGRAVASRAVAFGMKVVAFEPVEDLVFDSQHGIRRVTFDELLTISDVISLHLPLLDDTKGLFDRSIFDRMKPGVLFLNTARGGLVVEADLVAALKSGQVAGAGLDVFDQEPPDPDHPFRGLPNVILSPHLAGVDELAMSDMAEMAARCVVDLHQGRWPTDSVVNPEVRPGWVW